MSLGNRRRVALAFGVGVMMVFACVVGAVYGPTAYHVFRLKHEPAYLLQVVEASQDTARWRALENFLASRSGKERLLEVYLAEGIEQGLKAHSNLSMDGLLKGVMWSEEESLCFAVQKPNGEYWARDFDPLRSRWLAINRVLPVLKDEAITLRKYPGIRFSACTLDYQRLVQTGIALGARNWPTHRIPLAFVFEKVPRQP
jgi:hypothetical protein